MVSDQLLLVLKLCLLALLYLFFFRVVRAVWAELRPTPQIPAGGVTTPVAVPMRKRGKDVKNAAQTRQLLLREPAELAGKTWPLDGEVSIGRAAGCQVTSSLLKIETFKSLCPLTRGQRLEPM